MKNANIDSLAFTALGAPYLPPAVVVTPCDYDGVCEAADGALSGGAAFASDHNGHHRLPVSYGYPPWAPA